MVNSLVEAAGFSKNVHIERAYEVRTVKFMGTVGQQEPREFTLVVHDYGRTHAPRYWAGTLELDHSGAEAQVPFQPCAGGDTPSEVMINLIGSMKTCQELS
jgi:hypothetical protein